MNDETTGIVRSKDGTAISYRRLGQGPGLVLLHGAMQTGHGNIELARDLAADFTCYVPDRRGRGRSGPAGDHYGVEREVEDLDALLTATGAERVFGVSSGAVITLRTALVQPRLCKAVIFEPPLELDGSDQAGWLARFDREIARGDVEAALVTGMLAARMGPALFRALPRRVLERLTGSMLARQDRAGGGEGSFRILAPTLHNDGVVVAETAGTLQDYRRVQAEVLLLGGGRSPAHLKRALAALETVLPAARRTELRGVSHGATSNAADRGRPAVVAGAVREFLIQDPVRQSAG